MARIVDTIWNLHAHLKVGAYKFGHHSAAMGRGSKTLPAEEIVRQMDEAGVWKVGLGSTICAVGVGGEVDHIHADEVQAVVEKAPDRLYGVVGINPLEGMETLRYMTYGVEQLKFKAVHCYPQWWGLPVNHPRYYPIYAKCCELGVPILLQVGAPGPRSGARLAAKPEWLEQVAIDFPDLVVCGLHIGWPWTQEMIWLARNFENVYILADAHRPSVWEPALIDYMKNKLRNSEDGHLKVMWGTDWPIQTMKDSLAEVAALKLGSEITDNLLGETAIKVFKL